MLQPTQTTPRISRFDTLRARLTLGFLVAVLLPLLGIILVQVIASVRGGQQDVVSRLDTVASYKESAIQSWASTLTAELNSLLVGQSNLQDIQQVILVSPASPEYLKIRPIYNAISQRFTEQLSQSANFTEIFLINQEGRVILSTNNTQEGQIYKDRPFFQKGLQGAFVEPPTFSQALGRLQTFASYPVFDQANRPIGVIAGRVNPKPLQDILKIRTGLGETGESMLVGSDFTILIATEPKETGRKIATAGATAALQGAQRGSLTYLNHRNIPVVGVFHRLPNLEAALIIEQEQAESARVNYALLAINGSLALASLLITIFLALLITRSIAQPIGELATTATQIAAGNRQITMVVDTKDEIGVLALAVNNMAEQLNALIGGLEQRIEERTHDLEVRTNYLQASAEVSRATASILDPNELLRQAVNLIKEHFKLYYVGLFLADERHEWAVLRAGTGEAGRAMLARGHRLPIGRASMIGWCIANAQARIAQEAATDTVRLAPPELPDTQSEAAIPLRSRGQVIGALSVQSDQPNAFDETALAVLQALADQLAIAIENARLLTEIQQRLEAERQAYAAQTLEAWKKWVGTRGGLSFRGDAQGVYRSDPIWYPEMVQAVEEGRTIQPEDDSPEAVKGQDERGQPLAIPIKVRGQVIGVLDTRKAQGLQWSAQEVELLETVAEQLGVALESARLYTETQQKADQERIISQVSSQMRRSLNVEAVLKSAVEEIYRSFGLKDLVIQLTPPAEEEQGGDGHLPSSPTSTFNRSVEGHHE